MTYEETMYQKLVVDNATNEATLDDLCPNSGASMGVCGCVSCSDTTAYRAILTDLIADLREVFDTHPLAPSLTASVRACMGATETRLKGLNDV